MKLRTKKRETSLVEWLRNDLIERLAEGGFFADSSFPLVRYQNDPVGFCRDYLGFEPWSKQREILEALVNNPRIAVRSGHKIGKSKLAACAAIWFYCCFPDARVIMTSVTARQVEDILWREVKKTLAEAVKAGKPEIPGKLGELARTGLRASDFRQIVGFTAKRPEAVAGISGINMMYVIDEASGVPDAIFEAIEGNRAGGVNIKILMLSNPTQTVGEFFRAFHDKQEFYKTFAISSEESPNVVEKRIVVPGLATWDFVEEKRKEWGEDSAIYQVRIKGNFAKTSERAIIGLDLQIRCEEAYQALLETGKDGQIPLKGRLHVGVDVARYGDDEAVIALRRGKVIFKIIAFNGLSEEALVHEIMQAVRGERSPNEKAAMVKVDACGSIGMKVCALLMPYDSRSDVPGEREIELIPVNVAENAPLENMYCRLRDQLWFALRDWMRAGGAIVPDTKLAAELVAPTFEYDVRNRQKVSSKDDLRKTLKRSPDRADACTLAAWDPRIYQPGEKPEDASPPPAQTDAYDTGDVVVYSPHERRSIHAKDSLSPYRLKCGGIFYLTFATRDRSYRSPGVAYGGRLPLRARKATRATSAQHHALESFGSRNRDLRIGQRAIATRGATRKSDSQRRSGERRYFDSYGRACTASSPI